MTDDEFYEQAIGDLDGADSAPQIQPIFTALLTRTFPTYTETMWIHGYPSIRQIVITVPKVKKLPGMSNELPGLIREIPIGWRDMRDPESVRSRCEQVVASYVRENWRVKSHEVRG